MSNRSIDFEDELDYEMNEIDERFGGNFSQVSSKAIRKSAPKKNKEPKFKKDGFYEKNRK